MQLIKYSLLAFPVASLGLGVWQIQRLEWKRKFIKELDSRIHADPSDLYQINSIDDIKSLEYKHIKLRGNYDNNPNHQVIICPRLLIVNDEALKRGKTAHQSNLSGCNVITPFQVEGTNLRILVNRGWLPMQAKNDPKSLEEGLGEKQGKFDITGILRLTDTKQTYGSKTSIGSYEWLFRDVEGIAKTLNSAPIFIDVDQDITRTTGPIGGQTRLTIRNEHLNYIITWFSLSALSFYMWYSTYGKKGFKRFFF